MRSTGIHVTGEFFNIQGLYLRNFRDHGVYLSKSALAGNIQFCALNDSGTGIYSAGDRVHILGNHIGINPSNGALEGNAKYGIEIEGIDEIEVNIGEEAPNIIGDNGGSGIYIHGNVNPILIGNYLGTRENRDIYAPNGYDYGFGCGMWLDFKCEVRRSSF